MTPMTTQERAAHTDTARSAALMPGERCPAPCPACKAMTESEAIGFLEAAGYRVTKARATVRTDGIRPGRPTGKGHGEGCAEHWTVPGYTRALCVLRPGTTGENGLPIGPDWTDRDRVLAFAVEMRSAMEARSAVERAKYAEGR